MVQNNNCSINLIFIQICCTSWCKQIHICTQTCTGMHARIHTLTLTFTRTYVCVYTHTQTHLLLLLLSIRSLVVQATDNYFTRLAPQENDDTLASSCWVHLTELLVHSKTLLLKQLPTTRAPRRFCATLLYFCVTWFTRPALL